MMDMSCQRKKILQVVGKHTVVTYTRKIHVAAPPFRTDHACPEEPPPLISAVREAINLFKLNKSPGCDNTPAEFLKVSGDSVIHCFHKLCLRI